MPAEVVDLAGFKLVKAAARVRDMVRTRLGLELTRQTALTDLDDQVLASLISFEPASTDFLQDLIARLLDVAQGQSFDSLDGRVKMAVLDSYVALLDQLRFECLRRLGWIVSYPGQGRPLVEVALEPESVRQAGPALEMSPHHPDQPEFELRRETDGEVVVRQLIPSAVETFIARHGRSRPGEGPPPG
ncbi:MAG: hypothetical protein JRJ59_08245 [Deltaproteobacteria bacterium]|nr:hypothetical protein [Deltaproteobacteria bacterium]